jgi:hypothetical protein
MAVSARALNDMRSRLRRLEERGAKRRQLALEAMTEVGLTKLEQPDFTASPPVAPLSSSLLNKPSRIRTWPPSRRSSIGKAC